jgi:uncharacterized protein (DUF2384 family)
MQKCQINSAYLRCISLNFTIMTAFPASLLSSGKPYLRPVTDLIQQARRGVLRQRVDEISQIVGLTDKEMAHILNMSVRSLHGKADGDQLSLAASERLLLLERLVQHGLVVFEGRADLFGRWLHTPLHELSYKQTPAQTPEQPVSVRELGSFQGPQPTYERSTQPKPLAPVVPQSPLAVLDTVSGFSLADDVLGRIEWGIVG